jgi:hypothetical protein
VSERKEIGVVGRRRKVRIEPPAGSGGIGQAHGVGQRIKATFSVSKSLCRKKIYYCLSTPPMLLGAKHQA